MSPELSEQVKLVRDSIFKGYIYRQEQKNNCRKCKSVILYIPLKWILQRIQNFGTTVNIDNQKEDKNV